MENYRKRLARRGMARFEVLGLKRDRELLRAVARRLAEDTTETDQIRATLQRSTAQESGKRGGVLAALRRWPLADLNLERTYSEGRKIDL
jgi:hypothetical protein